jgi:hypothetical protein
MLLNTIKTGADIFACLATGIAALLALVTYKHSLLLERAKWLMDLYEIYYERDSLKKIRDLLDEPQNTGNI